MTIIAVVRAIAFIGFVVCSVVALASWALTQRTINRFSLAGRMLRRISDPIMLPVERWRLERGGNPQNAPWWLFGFGLVGAIVLVTATQFIVGMVYDVSVLVSSGSRGIVRLVVYLAFEAVLWALIIRVIASWFGMGRFNRWLRPAYVLTDWIITPLRRVIPPVGMFDFTPIIAWFLLRILMGWIVPRL